MGSNRRLTLDVFLVTLVALDLPVATAASPENLIGNGTFGAALWGWTYDVSPRPDAFSEANISYDQAKGINSPDGAARVHLYAEKNVQFMPWLGVQFRTPEKLARLEVSAWHRAEAHVENSSRVATFELLKLEDQVGSILESSRETDQHGDLLPTALNLTVNGARLRAGDSFTVKLFSMVTLNATVGNSSEYTVFWDDVRVMAVFEDPPWPLIGVTVGGVATVVVVALLLIRRRRKKRAEDVRIDDVFLLHNDGRLIKHFTRATRPSFDSETFGSMMKALELFVVDTLGKGKGGELEGIEFGGQKIRFVKGRKLTLAAIVAGEDEKGAVQRSRRALEAMEREHAPALEAWSGSSDEVGFANGYIDRLLAGGFGK